MKLRLSQALAGLVVVSFIASACSPRPSNVAVGPTPTPKPIVVKVAPVKKGNIQSVLSYSGSVQAASQVNVLPKITAPIAKLNVDVGSVVKTGDVIAVLDTSTLAPQVEQAQASLESAQTKLAQMKAGPRSESVAQAQANLDVAQQKLAALQDGPRSETVAQAKANLDAAQAKLAQLKAGPTQGQIKAAELQVEQAKNALYATQVQKDGNCNPQLPGYMCKSGQASANASETAVQVAQQQLNNLMAPPTQDELKQAQAAVDQAQQAYNLAQAPYTSHDIAQAQAAVQAATAQLDLAKKPYTSDDLKLAQSAVDQARAGLDAVKLQVQDGTVTSPIDGVISQKLLDNGAMATPATPIVTIISKNVEVDINVEEAKLGLIQTGQKATISVSAYPGVPFAATVIGDPPTVDPKSRSAVVRLSVVDPKGQLKPGMYAQVSIAVQPQQNVLLVPISALVNNNGQNDVYLVENGVVKVQPVTLGVQDANNAEVTQGLSAGQTIVVGEKPILNTGDRVTPTSSGS